MKKVKRFKNDPLQIIGSILTVLGLLFIIYPICKAKMYQTDIHFSFLGIVTGRPALIAAAALIIIGLIFVLITQPLVKKQKRLEDTEKKK